jgi:hypothetical protein
MRAVPYSVAKRLLAVKSERRIACRKQVAALLEAVLDGSVEARDAINCWPCFCNSDPSVQCAYTMLWYWEADEDRRWQEMMYSDLQFQQLQNCVQLLKLGHPLPHQVMIDYLERLAPQEFSEQTWVSRPVLVFKRFVAWFHRVWQESFQVFLSSLPSGGPWDALQGQPLSQAKSKTKSQPIPQNALTLSQLSALSKRTKPSPSSSLFRL